MCVSGRDRLGQSHATCGQSVTSNHLPAGCCCFSDDSAAGHGSGDTRSHGIGDSIQHPSFSAPKNVSSNVTCPAAAQQHPSTIERVTVRVCDGSSSTPGTATARGRSNWSPTRQRVRARGPGGTRHRAQPARDTSLTGAPRAWIGIGRPRPAVARPHAGSLPSRSPAGGRSGSPPSSFLARTHARRTREILFFPRHLSSVNYSQGGHGRVELEARSW